MPRWAVNKMLEWLERHSIPIILILWACFRIFAYGDPALSIAGNDTQTFVEASRVPLFSADMMTGRRLLTTNLIYKILEPESGYQILVNGSLETSKRILQPGFDRIVILQLILSIFGWSALTWTAAAQLKSFSAKLLTALVIPAFAFAPQVADWDSILMSESLTFSLFALQLSILIHVVFTLRRDPKTKVAAWMITWGVVYFLWANLRDTNNYATLVLFGLAALTLFLPKYRKHKALIGAMIFAAVSFSLGILTFQASGRALISTINLYVSDIFPFPARVEYMQGLGMPAPQTPGFNDWFQEYGLSSVTKFILSHPGYAIEKIARDFPEAFKEIQQTYFNVPSGDKLFRSRLVAFGETFHPETSTPFSMSLLTLLGIFLLAASRRTETAAPWAWIGAYLFLAASIAIIPTILGDTWAINRHSLFSTTFYRLSMWLFPLVLLDIALFREPAPAS